MEKHTSESGLAELERSKAAPNTLLEQAAKILGIHLDDSVERCFEGTADVNSRPTSFREQWVLRWLLKKLNSELEASERSSLRRSSECYLLNCTSWILLFDLMNIVENKPLLEILFERKFFNFLDEGIKLVIEHVQPENFNQRTIAVATQQDAKSSDRPMKRRRLSPSPEVPLPDKIRLISEDFKILFVVLNVCRVSAALLDQTSNSVDDKYHPVTAEWSTSAVENASLFGSSLRLISTILHISDDSTYHILSLDVVKYLPPFWKTRPVATNDSESSSAARAFNAHCLKTCLDILETSQRLCETFHRRNKPFESSSRLASQVIERLVAQYTIIPARTIFSTNYSKTWKMDRNQMTWSYLEKFYKEMSQLICSDKGSESVEVYIQYEPEFHSLLSWLFAIALRLLPRSDSKRRQSERPWLEALLLVLAYMSSPRLPRMERASGQNLEVLDIAYPPNLPNLSDKLSELFQIATKENIQPSSQILQYITSAIISWDVISFPWALLATVVKMDVNVLIPNSGLPVADRCFAQLTEKIESSSININDYSILTRDILSPVLRGFARSRALKDFALLWGEHLQEAMRVQRERTSTMEEGPAVLVWHDEDLFEEFQELVKLHATPTLGHDLLVTFLPDLKGIADRVGTTLDIFAKIAIFSSFLHSWNDSYSSLTHTQLAEVHDAAIIALERRSDYQSQRWRLWNLVGEIRRINNDMHLSPNIFKIGGERGPPVSLNQLQKEIIEESVSWAAANYMECLARFRVLTENSTDKNVECIKIFNIELKSLESIYTAILNEGPDQSPEEVWNGRVSDMNNLKRLTSACLGVLMTRPNLLATNVGLLKTIPSQVNNVTVPQSITPANAQPPSLAGLATSLIRIAEVSDNNEVRSDVWTSLANERELPGKNNLRMLSQSFPLEGSRRSQLKKAGDFSFESLKDAATIDNLAIHLSFIERLSSFVPMSCTQPGSWRRWVDMLDQLSKSFTLVWSKEQPLAPASFFVCIRCITNILRQLWTKAAEAVPTKGSPFEEMIQWCQAMTSSKTSFQYGITSFLALHVFIKGALGHEIETDSQNMRGRFEELRKHYLAIILKDTHKLLKSRLETTHLATLHLILEALIEVHAGTVGSKLFQDIATVVTYIKEWKISRACFEPVSIFADLVIAIESQCEQLLQPVAKELKLAKKHGADLDALRAETEHLRNSKTEWAMTRLAQQAHIFVQTRNPEARDIVLELLESNQVSDPLGTLAPLIVAATTLSSTDEHLAENRIQAVRLAHIGSLQRTQSYSSVQVLVLDLENAKLVLDLHASTINQVTMDELCQSIYELLSSTGTRENGRYYVEMEPYQNPSLVYDRVCSLLGSVLGRFRRRLSDRYHLLLPVLQQLLRCLFYAGMTASQQRQQTVQGSNSAMFLKTLPRWLRTADQPLPPTSAEKFSRLLSSVCNPTVSAARSSRKRAHSELIDETKRAKAIAGQHMQYLLMDYARCSLDGHTQPEVKEKLMPGLYSAMDSMNRDLMRAMNAAMDPSSRAIFKNLYDDWTRHGKWDRS